MPTGDVNYYNNLARSSANAGDYDGAIGHFTKAIELAPNNAEYRFNRGWNCMKVQRFEMAIEDFSVVLRANPIDDEAYHYRATAYQNTGAFSEALNDMNEAIRINPNKSDYYLTRELKVLKKNKLKQDKSRKSCKMWLRQHKSTLGGKHHVSTYQ